MQPNDQQDIIKKVKSSGEAGEEGDQDASAPEPQDPAANPAPVEPAPSPAPTDEQILTEMALDNINAERLIALYDNGDDKIKHIITKMIAYNNDYKNRENFLEGLKEMDEENLINVFGELKKMGIEIPPSSSKLIDVDENFMLDNPKKNNMFQKGSNDMLEPKSCKTGYKQNGMKTKNGIEVPNCVPIKK